MPWETLLLSVGLYIVVPVVLAQVVRAAAAVARRLPQALAALLKRLQPASLVALLATLVLLFGFQGEQIIGQPLTIALLAVPILIRVYFNAGLAYLLNRWYGRGSLRGGPVGPDRRQQLLRAGRGRRHQHLRLLLGAALATVVGVLIEVPVMLTVVRIANASKGWYESGAQRGGPERPRYAAITRNCRRQGNGSGPQSRRSPDASRSCHADRRNGNG